MPEKIKNVNPPRGLARLGFRLPIWLYRLGLGGLLGTRFLLLTHTGRKSGRKRQTILEVVRYDETAETFTVAAGFGTTSDWYRNVCQNPQAHVQCGHRKWAMTATFLSAAQAGDELVDYYHRHPTALRELAHFMGYRMEENDADVHALGKYLSMVTFRRIG